MGDVRLAQSGKSLDGYHHDAVTTFPQCTELSIKTRVRHGEQLLKKPMVGCWTPYEWESGCRVRQEAA